MPREANIRKAQVGRVSLTYDLSRIEGDVRVEFTDLNGQAWEGQGPITDFIRACSIMGGEFMADTARLLEPYLEAAAPQEPKVTALEARENAARYDTSCRHKRYEGTLYCAEMSCYNYAGKHEQRRAFWSDEIPEAPRRLGLSPEEEAEGVGEERRTLSAQELIEKGKLNG